MCSGELVTPPFPKQSIPHFEATRPEDGDQQGVNLEQSFMTLTEYFVSDIVLSKKVA